MAAGTQWRTLFVICGFISLQQVRGSQEVMTKLAGAFGNVMQDCKAELGVGDHIIQDFYNFWRENYELVNRDMGCMVICMASKLDLLDGDMNMHHGKTHEYAKSHGADDDMAKQLVTILHDCDKSNNAVTDPCNKALEISKCFRIKIHDLKWTPNMQVLLEEVMTDI